MRGKFENNAFKANFSTNSPILNLFLPRILKTFGFYLPFHLFLVYRTWISKDLASFGLFQAGEALRSSTFFDYFICNIPVVICKLDLVFFF